MGGATRDYVTRDVTPIHETARELYSYLSKNKLNNLYILYWYNIVLSDGKPYHKRSTPCFNTNQPVHLYEHNFIYIV